MGPLGHAKLRGENAASQKLKFQLLAKSRPAGAKPLADFLKIIVSDFMRPTIMH